MGYVHVIFLGILWKISPMVKIQSPLQNGESMKGISAQIIARTAEATRQVAGISEVSP